MVNLMRSGGLILLALVAMLLAQTAAAESIARAQRQAIGIDDSFQLVVSTDQDLADTPDFGPLLRDFEILGRAQSSNVSITNGRMTRATIWTLELLAKREGKLLIPPLTIGNERTAALAITVTANSPTADGALPGEVDLEVDVDNLSPYVQQQFIFTLRLVHTVQFSNASLTEPSVTGGNVIIEKLGDDVSYESMRGQTRVGIIERRYALFAQSSEPIVIESLRFEGRVAENRGRGFDPFGRGRLVRKQSDEVAINVLPVPTGFDGSTWLPVRQLMLVENSPAGATEYRVGEPFTRTLTLQATGLSASQLPQIDMPVPAGIKQYPDQPTLENRVGTDGLIAIRQEKIALIPGQPGQVTLPAIEIPWWNTQTSQQEYARLPARTIEVLPALLQVGNATPLIPAVEPSTEVAADAGAALPLPVGSGGFWQWFSLALALGWVVTVIAWIWSRRRQQSSVPASSVAQPRIKTLLAAIKAACDDNAAAACNEALLNWAKLQWSGSSIRSLGALAAMLDGELQEQVHALSQSLYRQGGDGWNGQQFWQAFAAYQERSRAATSPPPLPQLEPMYR